MRKLILLLLLYIIYAPVMSQDIYDQKNVKIIKLQFYDSNWDVILDTFMAHNLDSCVLAELEYEGKIYDSVGVRYKGNSSYNPNIRKNPLHIEIDYIIKNQTIDGCDVLKLSNLFKDPSYVREVLGYMIASNYLPVSRANYAYLFADNKHLGLYTNVESVDNLLLERSFGSSDHSFFKCDPVFITGTPQPPPPGCPPVQGMSSALTFINNDTICYTQSYEIKSDYGWKMLFNMIKALNQQPNLFKWYFNTDRALWMLAFNNIFVNLDSYSGSGHNYYLYQDDSNRFQPILWDLNECFGVFRNAGGGSNLDNTQLQTLAPDLNIANMQRPLIQKLLNNQYYRKRYFAHYRTILNEFVYNDSFLVMAKELKNSIDSFVKIDPNKKYTYTDFTNAIEQNVGSGPGAVIGLNVLMDNRKNFLKNHIEVNKTGPVFKSNSLSDAAPPPNKTINIRCAVNNASAVNFYVRRGLFDPFFEFIMYDDGNHNDSMANDGIWGCSLPPQSEGERLDFYFYAENNDAGKFLPERAEFNYFTAYVKGQSSYSGKLVINELMASNKTYADDQNGEFDDWIELYNNSDQKILLKNFNLSDDRYLSVKWTFPDTFIKSRSYLVIWADNDLSQRGLHAAFKLSASGESLYLYDNYGNLIDGVVFFNQSDDVSYGRYPNATGSFCLMTPTINASNTFYNSLIENNNYRMIVYPNPANTEINVASVGLNKDDNIEIFNITGQKILNNYIILNNSVIKINIENLPDGLYLLKIGNKTARFIVKSP